MKSVNIYLRTTQQVDDICETTELTAKGTYLCTPDKRTVTFTESTEEGMVTTLLTLTRKDTPVVTMVRKGTTENRMTIQQGVCHQGPYQMGPYTITLGVTGLCVSHNLTETGGSLFMQYALTMNGQDASKNTIELSIK